MTTEVIIPGGMQTARPYEYCATVVPKPKNETLAWLTEQERSHNVRSRIDIANRP